MIAHPTCFVSREVYQREKYDTAFKSASDYDFVCRLVKKGASFKFLPVIMANFRTGGSSYTKVNAFETEKIRLKYKFISPMYYVLKLIFLFLWTSLMPRGRNPS